MIAFDTWVLSTRFRHQGIYTYAMNVLLNLQRVVRDHPEAEIRYFVSRGCANDATQVSAGPRFQPMDAPLLRFDRLWSLGGVNLAAARAGAHLLFAPTSRVIPLGRVPVVATIHDLTMITSPSLAGWKNAWLRYLTRNAARLSWHVITVSHWSKKDLVEIYDLPPEKVSVVYEGYDRDVFNPELPDPQRQQQLLSQCGIRAPYLFHHGAIQPRKNLQRLIQAYRLLLDRHPGLDLQLVLAGPLGWRYDDILRTAGEAGYRGKVVLTGPLPTDQLAALLKGAAACVIPSLYEGFCLPMLESMACGVPTVVSNSSCLPEISGRVLHYFDPTSVEDMARAIWEVLDSTDLQAQLVRNGKQRAAWFNWERCAEETLQVLLKARKCPGGCYQEPSSR